MCQPFHWELVKRRDQVQKYEKRWKCVISENFSTSTLFFGEVAWGQKTSQRTIINIRKYPFSVPISPYIHNLSFVFLLDFDRRNNLKFNCFLEKKKDETIISLFPSQNVFSSRYCLVFGKSLATALLNLARKPFEISIMSNDQDNGLVHHACVPQCVAGS